ncbi:MAG: type ISP restriction/modification enzyme [Dolichospermum lemmermannii FEM_B0920]
MFSKYRYDPHQSKVRLMFSYFYIFRNMLIIFFCNFYIGGYQVCQKWLKDRKGRELNFDDISHYQNIISIISETMKMMEDVDRIIEKYGGFPLQ